MRLNDLDLRELFEFEPQGGLMRFAGERALIFNAVALGILRKTVIELIGLEAARGSSRASDTRTGAVPRRA